MSKFIAALPMYDWPERRAEVDAEWAAIRDQLRGAGVDAPDGLTRDFDDPHELWRRPNLLFAQTCWGPMELGLADYVQVIGQPGYDGIEGGQGINYSSAIVMRRKDYDIPPSVLSDISPSRGEISHSPTSQLPISSLEGEMSDRTVRGGASFATLPLNLLRNARLAYNSPDSMSGLIGLKRDLEALGGNLDIFSERIETGGHRLSVKAVAEGRADIAAIDCRSWRLAKLYEPEAAGQLQVAGWTVNRKGLPFITAKSTPPDVVAALRAAVR